MRAITEHLRRWVSEPVHCHAVVRRAALSILAHSLDAAFASPAGAQTGAKFEKECAKLVTDAKKEGRR
ncbi:MAG: hypothetical protein O7D27_10330, partial [Alphaproteobacteria bacterium]|nr:hypothetical protein [Alphaproteobacteria bacterium]